MTPLLLLGVLAFAHGGDADHHHHIAPEDRRVGDLAVESALTRLGLEAEQAVQVSTRWMQAIPAPERSRAEGRTAGWAYGQDRAWVTERRMHDGREAMSSELTGTWRDPTLCARMPPQADTPLTLTPLEPPVRDRGLGEQRVQDNRLDLTVAERDTDRLVLVDLEPGESATTVELVPDDDARPRRRARVRRRLSLSGHEVDLDVHETVDSREVCLSLHPQDDSVQVFVEREDLQEQVHDIMERESDKTEDGVAGVEESSSGSSAGGPVP